MRKLSVIISVIQDPLKDTLRVVYADGSVYMVTDPSVELISFLRSYGFNAYTCDQPSVYVYGFVTFMALIAILVYLFW